MPVLYDQLDTIDGIHRALEGMTADEEGFVAVFKDCLLYTSRCV